MWIEINGTHLKFDKGIVTPFAGVWIEIHLTEKYCQQLNGVTPFAGVWIEIINDVSSPLCGFVTPFAGVWIEIYSCDPLYCFLSVTPFAGVWIEIMFDYQKYQSYETVTPFAGVWIEMYLIIVLSGFLMSLPSRECGLKY